VVENLSKNSLRFFATVDQVLGKNCNISRSRGPYRRENFKENRVKRSGRETGSRIQKEGRQRKRRKGEGGELNHARVMFNG